MIRQWRMEHPRYPQVELSEEEFVKLLTLVDALDHVQLLRLQCLVGVRISDTTPRASAWGPNVDTLPPPAPPPFPDEVTVELDLFAKKK